MEYLIYAVDDEESIRDLYSCLIEQTGNKIKCFPDGFSMFEALKLEIPDLFILDIMIDGLDGFQILDKLKADLNYSSIPVILVSAKGEELSKVKGLNLGADDYIEKPFGIMEFIARINSKLRLKKQIKEKYTYKDILIDEDTHEVMINNSNIDLSMTEYKILLYLIKNNNKAIDREDLWKDIWKEDFIVETRTLDMHITNLRKKLVQSEVNINSIRGMGYKLL